jgi:hypothetical protein
MNYVAMICIIGEGLSFLIDDNPKPEWLTLMAIFWILVAIHDKIGDK